MRVFLMLLITSFSFSQYTYSLTDNNSSSDYYLENVGPEYFENQITMHYFGSFTWGLCNSRFAQLNTLYESLLDSGYDQVKLIGIGYSYQSNSYSNWSNSNEFSSVCYDDSNNPTFNSWGASQRDFYVLDHEKNLVLEQNISGGLPDNLESLIINLISDIPNEIINGDFNQDGVLNVVDVVSIINLVLTNQYNEIADVNSDNLLNVVDIVMLVNLIIS